MKKTETETQATTGIQSRLVPVSQIRESEDNGRIVYEETAMKDLMQSIQGSGLQEPIVLRQLDSEDAYEVVDGHRRFRAVQRLKWTDVPATIKPLTVEAARLYRVATIFQRQGATPYEEARYLAAALKNPGMTRQELSKTCGIKPGTLRNRLELLEFPEEVAKRVGVEGFGVDHARVLAALAPYPDALAAGLKVADEKEKDGTMRSAPKFFEDIKKNLLKANLARDPGAGKYWDVRNEFPTFEGQAGKLPKLEFKLPYGEAVLVLDVAGFDGLVDKAKATLERRREKESAKTAKEDADEARRKKRRERQLEIERLAREWSENAMREALQTRLAGLAKVTSADLTALVLDALDVGLADEDVDALATTAGVPADRLRGFLAWNHQGPAAEQALFAESTPTEILRLVLAITLARSLDGHTGNWGALCGHWTGKAPTDWAAEGLVQAKELVKAKPKTEAEGESDEEEFQAPA